MGSRLLILQLVAMCTAHAAQAQTGEMSFKIPATKTSVDLAEQSVEITVLGTISGTAPGPYALAVTLDLRGVQDALTSALAAQLNRSDRCGDRLTVEHATLGPEAPSSIFKANVTYERYACAKGLGREVVKKLGSFDGVVEMRLTPQVADNNISLDVDIRKLDANDSLADSLRQDIGDSIESAIQNAADLKGKLPDDLQNAVTIQSVQFADGGAGRLWLTIAGQVHLSAEQLQRAVGK